MKFVNVGFSYDEERPVLKNISLHAVAGQTVALVGPTGAGKSTLVNLLTRFYEFDSGEIEIDGRPLTEIPRAQLRAAVGLVTQESFLFNGTVRDNLRLGRPGATDDELFAAAEAANARGVHRAAGRRGWTRSWASGASSSAWAKNSGCPSRARCSKTRRS